MKRLAYRTVLAWLMAANSMLLAYQAPSGHPLSRVLGAVALGYVSINKFNQCFAVWISIVLQVV